MSEKDFGPEISDLIVDYDPVTLSRRPVRKTDVLARLEQEGHGPPLRVARRLTTTQVDGLLDDAEVDGILVRSHLELQRLHEEFRVGDTVRAMIEPLLAIVRERTTTRPIRVVDVGCGLGFMSRWLAAFGRLGDDVEIVGVDYNRALLAAASVLAARERIPVRFLVANAFNLETPGHVFISTGVLHHFRGEGLVRLFAEHQRVGALGFVHVDIRPSWLAPIGSWIFHQARMREPLARWDGYWSAVRAHSASTLRAAIERGAPAFRVATLDANPGLYAPIRIFQAMVGALGKHTADLSAAYARFGARVEVL